MQNLQTYTHDPITIESILDRVSFEDIFIRAYLECALWAETDDTGEPLDNNYNITDFAPEALELAIAECLDFLFYFHDMILYLHQQCKYDQRRAGHGYR